MEYTIFLKVKSELEFDIEADDLEDAYFEALRRFRNSDLGDLEIAKAYFDVAIDDKGNEITRENAGLAFEMVED